MKNIKKVIRIVALYTYLSVLGLFLFKIFSIVMLSSRGYVAIGGEVSFLMLPVFYYLVKMSIVDGIKGIKQAFIDAI